MRISKCRATGEDPRICWCIDCRKFQESYKKDMEKIDEFSKMIKKEGGRK